MVLLFLSVDNLKKYKECSYSWFQFIPLQVVIGWDNPGVKIINSNQWIWITPKVILSGASLEQL
jgi:hypothetical protein